MHVSHPSPCLSPSALKPEHYKNRASFCTLRIHFRQGNCNQATLDPKALFSIVPVSLSHRLQLQSQIRPNLMKMRFPLSNSHHLPRLIFSSNFSPNPAVISFYERKIFSTNVSFISHTHSGISSFFSTYSECRKSIVNKINNALPAIFPA